MWVQELKKKGALASPLFNGVSDREEHARECYRYIVSKPGWSAEVFIAIAFKEHTYGTNANSVLHRNDTRSFTNARSLRAPASMLRGRATIIRDSSRASHYVKYSCALDSIIDGIYRVDEAGYAYAGLHSIRDIIKVWAPAEDSNDPEGYAWTVANLVTGLRSRELSPIPGGNTIYVPFDAADSRHYTKGRSVTWPDLFVTHHTDGFDSLNWLTRSPNSEVSATYLLNNDGTPRAQLVRHEDTPHTTGRLNPRTITSEWERYWTDPARRQFANGVPDSVYRNIGAHWATVTLIERARGNPYFQGLPKRSQMLGHNDVAATTCPGNLSIDRVYEETIKALLSIADHPVQAGHRFFKETGKVIYGGFRGLWEQLESYGGSLAFRVCGFPTSNEGWCMIHGEERRIQFFERCAMIWNPSLKHPWDVTFILRDDWQAIEGFKEDAV